MPYSWFLTPTTRGRTGLVLLLDDLHRCVAEHTDSMQTAGFGALYLEDAARPGFAIGQFIQLANRRDRSHRPVQLPRSTPQTTLIALRAYSDRCLQPRSCRVSVVSFSLKSYVARFSWLSFRYT
ncbi:hypothetical protein Y032_0068g274 [Ancylostoma ceylanicum]|uniref:Uncharacterized protein n=1 Tax=Ancylostoma ceylanicum TaxID=53326 RepID=A0A016TYF8_9BILA|nr:hypothetical protein Y032_0068g274 [Ancylostoma ceylanicum]